MIMNVHSYLFLGISQKYPSFTVHWEEQPSTFPWSGPASQVSLPPILLLIINESPHFVLQREFFPILSVQVQPASS